MKRTTKILWLLTTDQHNQNLSVGDCKVDFLALNTRSTEQPMDHEVIRSSKAKYQAKICK